MGFSSRPLHSDRYAESRAPERVLAVLAYHKVGEPPLGGWETWYHVPEALFVAQLRHLVNTGWEVIDLDRFRTGLTNTETLPRRAALITFDDGYMSTKEVALPCLQDLSLPAVVFVPTAFVGSRNDFDRGAEPKEAMCGWSDLRELRANGVSIQSHGVAHRNFEALDPEEQRRELLDSRRVIEDQLGDRVNAFSFPYGAAGSDPLVVDALLRDSGYELAFLYGGGVEPLPVADPLRIKRLAIGADTDLPSLLDR